MEMINEMVVKYIVQFVIVGIVAVFTGVILPTLKGALENLKGQKETEMLYNIAMTVVRSIEQEMQSDEGAKKKLAAKTRFIDLLKDKGIILTEKQLNAYIEEGVHIINSEKELPFFEEC